MGNMKQEQGKQEEEDEKLESAATIKHANVIERDAAPKAAGDKQASGLRSQGAVAVVDAAERKEAPKIQGRRAAPTRHDAMEIAGHERLAGYGNQSDRGPVPPVNGFDAKEALREEDKELQHSSEDAVADDAEAEKDASTDVEVLDEDGERNAKSLKKAEGDEEVEA